LRPLEIIIVTGMSGAGKSTALRALDDLGFYAVDNLPPKMAPEFVSLCAASPDVTRAAIGLHPRAHGFAEPLEPVLDRLAADGHHCEVVFLDASDAALVRRFSETRRPHPIAPQGELLEGISQERVLLVPLRDRATIVVDTTKLTPHELRRVILEHVSRGTAASMITRLVTFGFRHGLPIDADIVLDVRFLPNPYFVPDLKPLTGLDEPVSEWVLGQQEAQLFLDKTMPLLEFLIPLYEREGKATATIAIGCTGGRHRSVALGEAIAERLAKVRPIVVKHRDIGR
jgi:RNase adapter protein RapZ